MMKNATLITFWLRIILAKYSVSAFLMMISHTIYSPVHLIWSFVQPLAVSNFLVDSHTLSPTSNVICSSISGLCIIVMSQVLCHGESVEFLLYLWSRYLPAPVASIRGPWVDWIALWDCRCRLRRRVISGWNGGLGYWMRICPSATVQHIYRAHSCQRVGATSPLFPTTTRSAHPNRGWYLITVGARYRGQCKFRPKIVWWSVWCNQWWERLVHCICRSCVQKT